MNSEHEREPWIPARAKLAEALVNQHREAVVRELAKRGMQLPSWDVFVGEVADKGVDVLDAENTVYYWILSFEAEVGDAHNAFPIRILGSDSISLKSSSEPGDIQDRLEGERAVLGKGDGFRAGIDTKMRYLDVRLQHGNKDGGVARIFMAPDMPPIAVHTDDLDYVVTASGRCAVDGPYDLGSIDLVTEAFGDEAVEYLSDETCEQLIAALKTAYSSFPPDKWF